MSDMPQITYSSRTSTPLAANAYEFALARHHEDGGDIVSDFQLILDQNQNRILNNMATQRRIVQVIIADTNENVPLSDCILYKGSEQLTDATDQELFFESGIAEKLAAHNEKRVNLLDKDATKRSGRDVFLEPLKIRDLKMMVVVSATL